MKDTLFVQFREGVHRNTKNIVYDRDLLSNGFSLIYEACKDMGDFLWVDGGSAPRNRGIDGGSSLYKYGYNIELPIRKGTVYVSAFFARHLMQALCWAQMYPSINVVVGGPASAKTFEYEYNGRLVGIDLDNFFSNFRISTELAEKEILGELEPRRKWVLDIPKDLLQYPNAVASYPVERGCYWNNCLFCNEQPTHSRFKNDLRYLSLTDETKGWVFWLYAQALYPDFIREHLSKLPKKDVSFLAYVRADEQTLDAIESVEMPKNITLHTGLECPSNRVLELMQKGTTTAQYLRLIELLTGKTEILFFLIDGWDLLDEDIVEIEAFCKEASSINPEIALTVIKTLCSSPVKFDSFHKILGYPDLEPVIMDEVGEFKLIGYTPVWTDQRKKRNNEVLAIYDKYFGSGMTVKAKKTKYHKRSEEK